MDVQRQTELDCGRWDTCALLLARFYKRFISINLGYPYFSHSYTRQHIALADTAPNELHEYEINHSAKMTRTRCLLILVSLLFYVRFVSLPTINFTQIDFLHLERNVHEPVPGIYQFSCLRTNCSQFTDSLIMSEQLHDHNDDQFARRLHIGQTLMALPFFPLCHDLLRYLHGRAQYFGYSGMLITASFGFIVLLSGICLPIIQIFNPTGNLLLMFLAAPQVTRRVVHDRAAHLHDQLILSHTNFRDTMRARRKQAHLRSQAILRPVQRLDRQDDGGELHLFPGLDIASHFRFTRPDGMRKSSVSRLEHFGEQYGNQPNCSRDFKTAISRNDKRSLDGNGKALVSTQVQLSYADYLKSNYADDCVSIMRSYWWQRCASRLSCLFILISIIIVMLLTSAAAYHFASRDPLTPARSLAAQMKRLACSIWREQENTNAPIDEPTILLDLESHKMQTNLWKESVFVFGFAYPFCCSTLFLGAYLLTVIELTCWLHELITQLTVSVECARQLFAPNNQKLGRHSELKFLEHVPKMCSSLSLNQLRAEFKQLVSIRVYFVNCDLWGRTSSRLHSARALEATVLHAIKYQQMDLAIGTELLERLYISLRIFLEHVQDYAPTMTAMLAYVLLYIYGSVLASVWCIRSINDYTFWAIFMVVIGWLSANFFVLLASNFHAKAKRVHWLIWCLLAAMCHCRELRLLHLHSLWRKQAVALDMDGGLALKAFNIRITYVLIIQTAVASGTIAVFILRI